MCRIYLSDLITTHQIVMTNSYFCRHSHCDASINFNFCSRLLSQDFLIVQAIWFEYRVSKNTHLCVGNFPGNTWLNQLFFCEKPQQKLVTWLDCSPGLRGDNFLVLVLSNWLLKSLDYCDYFHFLWMIPSLCLSFAIYLHAAWLSSKP